MFHSPCDLEGIDPWKFLDDEQETGSVVDDCIPNQGLVIFVGANALVQTFVNVARRAGLKVVQDVRMVTTLEAAYQIIAEEGAGVQ